MGKSCSTLKKKKVNEVIYQRSSQKPTDCSGVSQSFIECMPYGAEARCDKPSWRKKNLSLDISIIEKDASTTQSSSPHNEEIFSISPQYPDMMFENSQDSDHENSFVMDELTVPCIKQGSVEQDSFITKTIFRTASLYARNSLLDEDVSYEDSEENSLYRSRDLSIVSASVPPSKIVYTLDSDDSETSDVEIEGHVRFKNRYDINILVRL